MSEISSAKAASPLPPSSSTTTPIIQQNTIESNLNLKNGKNTLSKRIEVENLAKEFQKKLGSNWDKYQTTISAFLVGKLSRNELTNVLSNLLIDSKMVRMHNQLLLANLANSLRDGPITASANSGFGNSNSNKRKRENRVKPSSQYEKLKKDIMGLPIRERRRIKSITRDSGKRSMANSALTLTRQSLLPKIPYTSDKEKQITGNTIEWTQDISHGIQTLLSTETFSLPDNENLKNRMLGIAREHGLTGNIDKNVVDLTYIGLENYLKNIIEQAIDTVRYRKHKYSSEDILESTTTTTTISSKKPSIKKQKKIILTNEDMVDTFNLFPYLVEPSGPIYRLHSVQLNDDCHIDEKTSIDSILKPKHDFPKTTTKSSSLSHNQSPILKSPPPQQQQQQQQQSTDFKLKIENGVTENTSSSKEKDTENGTQNETPSKISNGTPNGTPNTNGTSTPIAKPGINGTTILPNGQSSTNSPELKNTNVGTKDELNWLIYDILSTH